LSNTLFNISGVDRQAIYEEALNLLKQIPGYKDADKLAVDCEMKLKNLSSSELVTAEETVRISENLRTGGVFYFGHYEQDDDKSNRNQPIEWQVLAVENGRALVISKYGLETKPYNEERKSVTWEICTLRKWLNSDFYDSAFSTAEKSSILQVTNQNPDNPIYETKGGNATNDRIFLLSIDEAYKYFRTDEARKCYATDYAKVNRASVDNTYGTSWWWLRSPGITSGSAAGVYSGGNVNRRGGSVTFDDIVVRPAFWLSL